MNSVDFRLMIQQTKGEGQLPETKGFLYVGSYERPFGQIKITKQLRKMHNRIIECNYDGATSQWLFMRERTDKSFPNGYNTAMAVCNSIQRPVTQEFLLDFIKERGFKTMPPPPPPVARAPKRPHPPDEDRD
ncbi:unnamed protein product [Notodromas monacha]|uniref:mRNA capping enzyme C-terminal domain-containing protein n=1 Tax=Notodromas monacha TaxID=399045 RepID=A0A7R9BJV7_9CRUS|nr:unnamed protein product [Notodromas monacha]CAG0915314.1 unnamed protein product [Notodromas monacha]